MRNSNVLKAVLFLSGLLLILVGVEMLFDPDNMLGKHGININGNISLLNELKGHGGVLLGCGILILLGAFFNKLSYTSILVSVVVYLSFAIGRVIGILVDGFPSEGLIIALALEFIFGLLGLFCFFKYREKH